MRINPFAWSFRAQFLLGGAICFALVGFAIFSQLQWHLEPCPLCIFQRFAFIGLGAVFVLGGLFAPVRAGWRRVWAVLALAAAGVGITIAGRHTWLQISPPDIPACGPPYEFLRDTLSTTNLIRRVMSGSGDCGLVDWTFAGLSMPAWSLVWFVLLALWGLYAGLRRRSRRGWTSDSFGRN